MKATASITEPPQTLPVDVTCDVAITGGGIAGVAAALSAAREGLRVVVVEKQFGLGGLATLGHVVKYLPLCDGYGKQVMGGIAEELLHLSVSDLKEPLPSAGFTPVPACWKDDSDLPKRENKRLMSSFNPYAFQMDLEEVLEKAGVELMYDTRVCRVLKSGEEISHLIVENKSGRLAIAAQVFIDASGDADVCYLSGCAVENYSHNALACWHYEIKNGQVCLVSLTNHYAPEHREHPDIAGPFFSGTKHRDVTQHMLQSHKLLRNKLRQKREAAPQSAIHPFALPSIPDFRVTRCLKNSFSVSEKHRHMWFEDCIGITGDWRRKGPIYPIPLRAIHADDCPNLFVAGRCISSDHTVVDVTRAIGTCAVTGQAAGMGAALIIKDNIADRRHLPVNKLQQKLRQAGALIDPTLVKAHPKAEQKAELRAAAV